jgi:hypothetical protein
MDEIKDWRTQAQESADDWEMRHQIPRGRVHLDMIDNLANAGAFASPLRQRPALKLIRGGRDGAPRQDPRDRLRQPQLFVIK